MSSKYKEKDRSTPGAIIGVLILPVTLSLAATSAPEWSWGYAGSFTVILLLLLLYSLIITLTKWYKNTSWRFLYLIVVFNVTGVTMLIAVWRVYNENIWLGLIMVTLVGITVTLSIRHRQYLNNAIRNPKQYPFIGKLYRVVLIVSAFLVPSSYGISVALQSYFTADSTFIVLGAAMVPFAFLLIALSLSAVAIIKPQKS
ncbi:hypothetical protein ACE1TF_05765 [Geomicrobium sp. JSM 1781026]|uniref:hypothetical protein n=1 Tax=Geomicrobium sp. JSM 1781026 TaxID=3344580 RepID=UPI0035C1836B